MADTRPPIPLTFTPIKFKRAFEEVCTRIREQLANGALRPGDKLPPERQLAEQLGVSRNAIREALRSLENGGVVELQRGPKGGAFIRSGDPDRVTDAMEDMLSLGTITLEDLTEARLYLIEAVTRLACERGSERDLDAIERNVERTAALAEPHSYAERLACVMEFYVLLAKAVRNQTLSLMTQSLTSITQRLLSNTNYPTDTLIASRRRFMDLLRARDTEAAVREIRTHLQRMRENAELNKPKQT